MKKLNVAVVGLSFGLEFVPIYLEHPDVEKVYLVDTDASLLHVAQNRYGIPEENCTCEIQEVLDDPDIDAVHLVTPPATHAPLSIRVLKAGKHCGCTIPMGLSLDELNAVIAARKESNKNYMFMETTVFQREFLYVKQLHEKGELGRIQYMPYRVEKYFLYYNRDVFDITGIPYPTQNITWHEFQEIGFAMNQKLKELGMSEKKAILLLPDGNDLLRMTIPGLSSLIGGDMQQFGHSLDLMEQLLAEGTTISFAQSYEQNFQQNVFETGNYGMFITSSSYAPLLLDKQKDGKLDFDWGVVSQPFWPEEKSGNNIKIIIPICIYRYTKYPEAAWKFVSFMSGEQGASLTAENLLFPAYDSETVQKTLISAAQRHQIKADLVDNARRSSLPACPTASEIDIFSFISNEYMDTLMGLITKDQCIRKIEDLHSRFPK